MPTGSPACCVCGSQRLLTWICVDCVNKQHAAELTYKEPIVHVICPKCGKSTPIDSWRESFYAPEGQVMKKFECPCGATYIMNWQTKVIIDTEEKPTIDRHTMQLFPEEWQKMYGDRSCATS